MRVRSTPTGVAAALLLLSSACYETDGRSSSPPAAPFCQTAALKLRGCGLLTDGFHRCDEPDNDAEHCEANCLLTSPCEAIVQWHCQSDLGPYGQCVSDCRTGTRFECGDGSTIQSAWRCDAERDCTNGNDEKGCDGVVFRCESGEQVPPDWVCNGFENCPDGTDERGCDTFACQTGDAVAMAARCDDADDCPDGSDELNCAAMRCP